MSWNGMATPAGTPKPVIDRLHAEVVKAPQSPTVAERSTNNGFIPGGTTPGEAAGFIGAAIETWSAVAKESGVKVD